MKNKQQLTKDYQYLFEISDQLLLAYENDIFDEEIKDLAECLEKLSGKTSNQRWDYGARLSEEITNGKNTN